MIPAKPHYDASNPRDVATRKAWQYAEEGKIVPLVHAIADLCRPSYANDREVAQTLEYCVGQILEKGTVEDIRNVGTSLRSSLPPSAARRPFAKAATETLLGTLAQKLLQDSRFAEARASLQCGRESAHIDRYRKLP